jgi:predicted RNA-binding protein YlxR (DUF448 family)
VRPSPATGDGDACDAGPRKDAAGTLRTCAATGAVRPIEELIRFVVGPDGAVVPDLKRRLPGRGIWVTGTRQALGMALARKAFARAFKREVRAGSDLLDLTERLLERAALDALAMAHKAGRVAIGFGKAEAALTHERVAGLLHAAGAAPDGTRKLAAALQRRADAAAVASIDSFTSSQLDLALGRSNVVHAALLAGPESDTFLARTARLDCFRAEPMSGALTPGGQRRGGSTGAGRRRET